MKKEIYLINYHTPHGVFSSIAIDSLEEAQRVLKLTLPSSQHSINISAIQLHEKLPSTFLSNPVPAEVVTETSNHQGVTPKELTKERDRKDPLPHTFEDGHCLTVRMFCNHCNTYGCPLYDDITCGNCGESDHTFRYYDEGSVRRFVAGLKEAKEEEKERLRSFTAHYTNYQDRIILTPKEPKEDKMNEQEKQIEDLDRLSIVEEIKKMNDELFTIGESVFIRTVTYHITGRIIAVKQNFLILEDAAWIADDGRFMDCINDGILQEVEPVDVLVRVNIESFIDVYEWKHPLPRSRK